MSDPVLHVHLNPDMERYVHATTTLRTLYRLAEDAPHSQLTVEIILTIEEDLPWLRSGSPSPLLPRVFS